MNLLLDTCTFLWAVGEPQRLSSAAKAVIVDADNEVFVSAASALEIALKYSIGRLGLACPPHEFMPKQRLLHRFRALEIDEASALTTARLPQIHSDPFDRLLVSQSIVHGLTLVTPDPQIHKYPCNLLWS